MAVTMDEKPTPAGQPGQKQRPWRSLVALAGGIVLLVVIAVFMIWVGTLLT